MMRYNNVYIEALAWELPPVVVTTDELEERLDYVYRTLRIQPGQLEAMTGIAERRWWEPGTRMADAAARAALNLLRDTGFPAHQIEAVLYGGVCRDGFEPATACHVAGRLEDAGHPVAPHAWVYDVGNACLGALSAITDVANRIALGQLRAGLVVTAESAREIVEGMIDQMLEAPTMDTFKTAVATLTGGSGAVAVLLTDGSHTQQRRRRLLGGVTQSAPRFHDLCVWDLQDHPDHTPERLGDRILRPTMSTRSVEVLDHGTLLGQRTWDAFTQHLGWEPASIDRVVSHQVGSAHRAAYLKALGIPPEKDFVAYTFLGNTGSVALPLAAALAEQRGALLPGHRVALLGIGSGLNCTMLGVEW